MLKSVNSKSKLCQQYLRTRWVFVGCIFPNTSQHAWKLMPEIGPNRMSHSYQSSCLKFARVHFAFSARGAEIGQDFPF